MIKLLFSGALIITLCIETIKNECGKKDIIPTLENITQTFSEQLSYFSIINEDNKASKFSLREIHFENGNRILDEVKKTQFENLYWEEALTNRDGRSRGSIVRRPSS